jgi:hypothetical protein
MYTSVRQFFLEGAAEFASPSAAKKCASTRLMTDSSLALLSIQNLRLRRHLAYAPRLQADYFLVVNSPLRLAMRNHVQVVS